MKVFLNLNGIVSSDPHDKEACGLWPEAIPKLLTREGIEFRFGDFKDSFPMTAKDVEFLYKNVCRDEPLMNACANMVTEWRKSPSLHAMPMSLAQSVASIQQLLKLKGRTL